jgi:hypothetical protein
MHSFLMIGQSNMAGRGFLNEVDPIEDKHIFMLRNGRFYPMKEPINYDRPFSGISLAASFAEEYVKDRGEELGLIPCADGGSSLDDWTVGGELYDHAVFQSRLAKRNSEIKGILWHQGEADCSLGLIDAYRNKFLKIIKSLKKDLEIEHVPVLIGGLGNFLSQCALDENLKNYGRMNQVLKEITETERGYYYVDAAGLSSNPDYLHFNARSLREFGKRYYGVYKETL